MSKPKPTKRVKKGNLLPVKWFLQIPVVKASLKDSEGNVITNIIQVTEFKGAILVLADGGIHTDKPEIFAGFTPPKKKTK
jgi:hypothetical protein